MPDRLYACQGMHIAAADADPAGSSFPAGIRFTNRLPRADRCHTRGMPTDIYFSGESLRLAVDEDPDQLAEAFSSSQGRPFRVTAKAGGGQVWVNPGAVAFWLASDAIRHPEAQESGDASQESRDASQESRDAPNKRQDVTDLWGNPIRKRPRR